MGSSIHRPPGGATVPPPVAPEVAAGTPARPAPADGSVAPAGTPPVTPGSAAPAAAPPASPAAPVDVYDTGSSPAGVDATAQTVGAPAPGARGDAAPAASGQRLRPEVWDTAQGHYQTALERLRSDDPPPTSEDVQAFVTAHRRSNQLLHSYAIFITQSGEAPNAEDLTRMRQMQSQLWEVTNGGLQDALGPVLRGEAEPSESDLQTFDAMQQLAGQSLQLYAAYLAALPEDQRPPEDIAQVQSFQAEAQGALDQATLRRLMAGGSPEPQSSASLYRVYELDDVFQNIELGIASRTTDRSAQPTEPRTVPRRYYSWGRSLARADISADELRHFALTGQRSDSIERLIRGYQQRGTQGGAFAGLMHSRIAVLRTLEFRRNEGISSLGQQIALLEANGDPNGELAGLREQLGALTEQRDQATGQLQEAQQMYNREGLASAGRERSYRQGQAQAAAATGRSADELQARIDAGEFSGAELERQQARVGSLRQRADTGARVAANGLERLGSQAEHLAARAPEGSRSRTYFQDQAAVNFDGAAGAQVVRGRAAITSGEVDGTTGMPRALSDQAADGSEPSGALALVQRAETVTEGRALTDPAHLAARADVHRARREVRATQLHGRPGTEPPTLNDSQRTTLETEMWGESGQLLSTVNANIRVLSAGGELSVEQRTELGRLHAEARDIETEVAQTGGQVDQLEADRAQLQASVDAARLQIDGDGTEAHPSIDSRITSLEARRAQAQKQLDEVGDDEDYRRDTHQSEVDEANIEIARMEALRRSSLDQISRGEAQIAVVNPRLATVRGAEDRMVAGMTRVDPFGATRTRGALTDTDAVLTSAEGHATRARGAYQAAAQEYIDNPPADENVRIRFAAEYTQFEFGNARSLATMADISDRGGVPNIFSTDTAPATLGTQRRGVADRERRTGLARDSLDNGERMRVGLAETDGSGPSMLVRAFGTDAPAMARTMREQSVGAHAEVGRMSAYGDERESARVLRRGYGIVQDEMAEYAFTDEDIAYANFWQTQMAAATTEARAIVDSRLDTGVFFDGEGRQRRATIDASGIRDIRALESEMAQSMLVTEADRQAFARSGLAWPTDQEGDTPATREANQSLRERIARDFPTVANQLALRARIPDYEARYRFMQGQMIRLMMEDLNASGSAAASDLATMIISQQDAIDAGVSDIVGTYLNPVAWYGGLTGEDYSIDGMLGEIQRSKMETSYGARMSSETHRAAVGAIMFRDAMRAAAGPPDRREEVLISMRMAALTGPQRQQLFGVSERDASLAYSAGRAFLSDTLHRYESASDGSYDAFRRPEGMPAMEPVDYLTNTYTYSTADGSRSEDSNFARDAPILSRVLMSPGVDPRSLVGFHDADGNRIPNIQYFGQTRLNLALSQAHTTELNDDLRWAMYLTLGGEALLCFVPIPGTRVRAAVTASRAWSVLRAGATALEGYRAGRVVLGLGRAVTVVGREYQALATLNRGTRFVSGAIQMSAVVGGFHLTTEYLAHTYGRRSHAVRLMNLGMNFAVFHSAANVANIGQLARSVAFIEGLAIGPQAAIDIAQRYGPESVQAWARDPQNAMAFQMACTILIPAFAGARVRGEPHLAAERFSERAFQVEPGADVPPRIQTQREALTRDLAPLLSEAHLRPAPEPAVQAQRRAQFEQVLRSHDVPPAEAAGILRAQEINYAMERAIRTREINPRRPMSAEQARGVMNDVAAHLIEQGVHPSQAYGDAAMQMRNTFERISQERMLTDGEVDAHYGTAMAEVTRQAGAQRVVHQLELTSPQRQVAFETLDGHMRRYDGQETVRSEPQQYLETLARDLEAAGIPPTERGAILLHERHRVMVDSIRRTTDSFQADGIPLNAEGLRFAAEAHARRVLGPNAAPEHVHLLADSVVPRQGAAEASGAAHPTGAASPVPGTQAEVPAAPMRRYADLVGAERLQFETFRSSLPEGVSEVAGMRLFEQLRQPHTDPVTRLPMGRAPMEIVAGRDSRSVRVGEAELNRAYAESHPEGGAAMAEIDMQNLAGLNKHFAAEGGSGQPSANEAMRQIVSHMQDSLQAQFPNAEVVLVRNGGPRFSVFVRGEQVSAARLQGAMAEAQQSLRSWAETTVWARPEGSPLRLSEVPHPRTGELGFGFDFHAVESRPGEAATATLSRAGQPFESTTQTPQGPVRFGELPRAEPLTTREVAGRPEWQDGVAIRRDAFIRDAVESGMSRANAEAAFARFGTEPADGVTGFEGPAARMPHMESALRHAQETGQVAFYIEGDIQNLGRMTDTIGREQADRVYREMSQIGRDHLIAAGFEVRAIRHGGDEVSYVITAPFATDAQGRPITADAWRGRLQEALAGADRAIHGTPGPDGQRTGGYLETITFGDPPRPLQSIEHSKAGRPPGTGLVLGFTELRPPRTGGDTAIREAAGRAASDVAVLIEARKLNRDVPLEIGNTGLTPVDGVQPAAANTGPANLATGPPSGLPPPRSPRHTGAMMAMPGPDARFNIPMADGTVSSGWGWSGMREGMAILRNADGAEIAVDPRLMIAANQLQSGSHLVQWEGQVFQALVIGDAVRLFGLSDSGNMQHARIIDGRLIESGADYLRLIQENPHLYDANVPSPARPAAQAPAADGQTPAPAPRVADSQPVRTPAAEAHADQSAPGFRQGQEVVVERSGGAREQWVVIRENADGTITVQARQASPDGRYATKYVSEATLRSWQPAPAEAAAGAAPARVAPVEPTPQPEAPPRRAEIRDADVVDAVRGYHDAHRIDVGDRIPDGFLDGGAASRVDQPSFTEQTWVIESTREIIAVDRSHAQVAPHVAYARQLASEGHSPVEITRLLAERVDLLLSGEHRGNLGRINTEAERLLGPHEGQLRELGDIIGDGYGVCRHRALLFKLLADEAGLQTSIVRGETSTGTAHAWNEVIIDGRVHVVDTTFNTGSNVGSTISGHELAMRYRGMGQRGMYDGEGHVLGVRVPGVHMPAHEVAGTRTVEGHRAFVETFPEAGARWSSVSAQQFQQVFGRGPFDASMARRVYELGGHATFVELARANPAEARFLAHTHQRTGLDLNPIIRDHGIVAAQGAARVYYESPLGYSRWVHKNPAGMSLMGTDLARVQAESRALVQRHIASLDPHGQHAIRALSSQEAQAILQQAAVMQPRDNGLPLREQLSAMGLEPRYSMQIDGQTIHVSQQYDLGGGRTGMVGYVAGPDGRVHPRFFYRSNSQSTWRVASHLMTNDRGINHYGKGGSEEETILPIQFGAIAERIGRGDGHVQPLIDPHTRMNPQDASAIRGRMGESLAGMFTAVDPANAHLPQYQSPEAVSVGGAGGSIPRSNPRKSVLDPAEMQLPPAAQIPDFSRPPVDTFTIDNPRLEGVTGDGQLTARVYMSRDGSLRYLVVEDAGGRMAIAGVEPAQSGLTPFGNRDRYIDLHGMDAPLFEYSSQMAREHGGRSDSEYQLNWSYVSETPLVRELYRQQGRPMPEVLPQRAASRRDLAQMHTDMATAPTYVQDAVGGLLAADTPPSGVSPELHAAAQSRMEAIVRQHGPEGAAHLVRLGEYLGHRGLLEYVGQHPEPANIAAPGHQIPVSALRRMLGNESSQRGSAALAWRPTVAEPAAGTGAPVAGPEAAAVRRTGMFERVPHAEVTVRHDALQAVPESSNPAVRRLVVDGATHEVVLRPIPSGAEATLLQSARVLSELGIGPEVRGIVDNPTGSRALVVDHVEGRSPLQGSDISDASVRQLREAIETLESNGYAVAGLDYVIDSHGAVHVTGARGLTRDGGSPRVDPVAAYHGLRRSGMGETLRSTTPEIMRRELQQHPETYEALSTQQRETLVRWLERHPAGYEIALTRGADGQIRILQTQFGHATDGSLTGWQWRTYAMDGQGRVSALTTERFDAGGERVGAETGHRVGDVQDARDAFPVITDPPPGFDRAMRQHWQRFERSLRRLGNFEGHLTPRDVSGVRYELDGMRIPDGRGGFFDHVHEMRDTRAGVEGFIRNLEGARRFIERQPERSAERPHGLSPEQKQSYSSYIDRLEARATAMLSLADQTLANPRVSDGGS